MLNNLTTPSTGVMGSAGILHALLQRAERGGSYGVDVSHSSDCNLFFEC